MGNNLAGRLIDVGGRFSLGGEKRLKALREIGSAAIEADRHAAS
jgi:hypothetical protein